MTLPERFPDVVTVHDCATHARVQAGVGVAVGRGPTAHVREDDCQACRLGLAIAHAVVDVWTPPHDDIPTALGYERVYT